jgi:hypothetical protein
MIARVGDLSEMDSWAVNDCKKDASWLCWLSELTNPRKFMLDTRDVAA